MNRQLLCIVLMALLGCLHARAQQEMCICRADSCDVFDVRHADSIVFAEGFLVIGRMAPFSVQHIDSIVFRRPQLKATERGWWGDLDEGASRYEERLRDDTLHTTYHVSYRFTAHDGLCTAAECVIMFDSAEDWKDYMEHYVLPAPATDTNDPYIYVKETLTGPRRFELWVMSGPLLPVDVVKNGMVYEITDDYCPRIDLTKQLTGRTMTDVRLIVEGWLYNPFVLTDNPDYDPEKN